MKPADTSTVPGGMFPQRRASCWQMDRSRCFVFQLQRRPTGLPGYCHGIHSCDYHLHPSLEER